MDGNFFIFLVCWLLSNFSSNFRKTAKTVGVYYFMSGISILTNEFLPRNAMPGGLNDDLSAMGVILGGLLTCAGFIYLRRGIHIFAHRVPPLTEEHTKDVTGELFRLEWENKNTMGKTVMVLSAVVSVIYVWSFFRFIDADGNILWPFSLMMMSFIFYQFINTLLFDIIGHMFILEEDYFSVRVRDVIMVRRIGMRSRQHPPSKSFYIIFEEEEDTFSTYSCYAASLKKMVGKECHLRLCRDIFGEEFILGIPLIEERSETIWYPVEDEELGTGYRLRYSLGETASFQLWRDLAVSFFFNGVVVLLTIFPFLFFISQIMAL